jgi:pimeloyl-ACP methyl ester carboxylesterase
MSVSKKGRFGQGMLLDGRWTTTERKDTPLLVGLHGGGYDSRYFDAPGSSLLSRATAAGFPALALTRPGHPADEESARRQPSFAEAAAIIAEAIADAWQQFGNGRPGVVLLGHSIGGAIAVHIAAARTLTWPLLGLTVSGVGDVISPRAMEQFTRLPPGTAVDFPFEATRPVLYGPDWTLDNPALAGAADLPVTTPSDDMLEMPEWAETLPRIARAVEVPVQYGLAEFDGFWSVSEERVGAFGRLFSRAPFVDASLWRGAGHNIEHHRLGDAYVRAVLVFAERCSMERRRPATDSA